MEYVCMLFDCANKNLFVHAIILHVDNFCLFLKKDIIGPNTTVGLRQNVLFVCIFALFLLQFDNILSEDFI